MLLEIVLTELAPLEKLNNEARRQRKALNEEIASLQTILTKCFIWLDFTKWNQPDEGITLVIFLFRFLTTVYSILSYFKGNVHCLVVCIMYGDGKLVEQGEIWKPSIRYYDYVATSIKIFLINFFLTLFRFFLFSYN